MRCRSSLQARTVTSEGSEESDVESAQRDDEVSGRYTHGHHESVLRAHRWRTAQNSAGYLIPRLKPGMSILDVGCRPGTITVDLAELVAPGRVVGMDAAPDVISQASALGSRAEFVVGDAYALPSADREFDVVHAATVRGVRVSAADSRGMRRR